MTEVEQQPQTNGIETIEEEDNKVRPADIEAVCNNSVHFHFRVIVHRFLLYANCIFGFSFVYTGYA